MVWSGSRQRSVKWFGKASVVTQEEAPEYLRREYIEGWYRVGGGIIPALLSLFQPHNETLNAWTMIAMSSVSTANAYGARRALGWLPLPCILLWASVVVHMPFSVGLHLLIGIDETTRKFWRTLDVLFIQLCSVLLGGALGYYVFRNGYWLYMAICLACLARSIYCTMIVRRIWSIPKRELGGHVAVIVVASNMPIVAQAVRDIGNGVGETALLCLALAFVLQAGVVVYGRHLPEKWAPGKFDLLGNSHQLMHLAALGAHVIQWAFLRGVLVRFSNDWNRAYS